MCRCLLDNQSHLYQNVLEVMKMMMLPLVEVRFEGYYLNLVTSGARMVSWMPLILPRMETYDFNR
jgi:hypothetical protein